MNKSFSFILPAYKAAFLKEAIDSILAQTYTNFELIIVNDASPEDIDSIINLYDDSRISYYINEKNIGGEDLVAQWNHCIKYAKSDYIILASDDDVYSPLYLEKMNNLVEKFPEVDVFRPRIKTIDANNNTIHIFGYLKEFVGMPEFIYHWMIGHIGSAISYYLIKKEALFNHGGFISFPLAWGSDDATIISLSQNGIAFSSEILFSFRQSGKNISSKKNSVKVLKRKLMAYSKFFDWLQAFVSNINVPDVEEDKFYLNFIKSNLSSYYRSVTLDVLASSVPQAIILNVFLIRRLKAISVKDYLMTLYRCLVKHISK